MIPNVQMIIYNSKLIGAVNDTAVTSATETDHSSTGTLNYVNCCLIF